MYDFGSFSGGEAGLYLNNLDYKRNINPSASGRLRDFNYLELFNILF